MNVELVDHMGDDLLVVNAARVSFSKHKDDFEESDERLLNFLAKNNHWTPFAHPTICLRMKAPVFVRTQCFKHKQGFVENEVSRRYVDDAPSFFTPEEWRGRPVNSKQGSSDDVITDIYIRGFSTTPIEEAYDVLLNHSQELYEAMIENGVAPEQARMVLPQSMNTEWYWTGSLSAFARFYKQRSDPHAQKEIRDLAEMVGDIIEPLFPISWKVLT